MLAPTARNVASDAYRQGRTGKDREPLPGEDPGAPIPATDPWLAGHLDRWLERSAPHGADVSAMRRAILGYFATDPEDANRIDYPTILRRAGWSGR